MFVEVFTPLLFFYLVDAPLAAVTAVHLCKLISISFAHLDTAVSPLSFFSVKLLKLYWVLLQDFSVICCIHLSLHRHKPSRAS